MTPPLRLHVPPIALGLAGLLPQMGCVSLALARDDARLAAAVAGGAYSALILSFLGGMWWMQALPRSEARWWPYLLAVAPSLLAWAALLAVVGGVASAATALALVGLGLLASPLADRAAGPLLHAVPAWRRLRLMLSGGLGTLTLVLAAAVARG